MLRAIWAALVAVILTAAPASAAITFNWEVDSGATQFTSTTLATSFGANTPSTGTLMIMVAWVRDSTGDVGTLAVNQSWTVDASQTHCATSTPVRIAVAWKIATASETAPTVSWNATNTGGAGYVIHDYSNVTSTSFFDPALAAGAYNCHTGSATASMVANSISPSASTNLWMVAGAWFTGSAGTATNFSGLTGRASDLNLSNSAVASIFTADQQLAASGATGTATATMNATFFDYATVSLTLVPTGGGGGPVVHALPQMGVGK